MSEWLSTVRSGGAANTRQSIVSHNYCHVTDIDTMTILVGEAESTQYRCCRLEVLLCALTG